MNNQPDRLTQILKFCLAFCLYSGLLTVLMINGRFLFPFITLKALFFRTIVEISLFVYLLLAWHNSLYRPHINKLLVAILLFLVFVFFTALVGVNPYHSLWGNIERGEGFIFIAHLIIYVFILSHFFRSQRAWYNFFSFSILISLLVGLYGLAQALGLSWAIKNSAGSRWSSTLGNAAYLGAYALGHFWLSLTLFSQRRRIIWRSFYALTAIFNAYIVFHTQTRGAMLALIISLFLYLFFLFFVLSKKKQKIITLAIIFLFFSSPIIIWFNRQQPWVQKRTILRRLTEISANDITIQSRLYALDSSWRGWQDRFLFGYGWENFNVAFNRYFHPEIYRDSGSQIWFDRAHNTLLDMAIASGLVGLLSYLSIYFLAFIYLINFARRSKRDLFLSVSLSAFLLAHFIQNLVVFDSLPTYIMLFSVLAFIVFLGRLQRPEKETAVVKLKPLSAYIYLPLFILLVWSLNVFNLRPARANSTAMRAIRAAYSHNLNASLKYFSQATQYKTYQNQEINEKLAETVLEYNTLSQISNPQELKSNFDLAIRAIKENIQSNPLSAKDYLLLMALYNNAALRINDIRYLYPIEMFGKTVLKLSPTRPQIYYELGRAQMSLGNFKQGINYFKQAIRLNPQTLESHWNLLLAYAIAKQKNNMDNEYEHMLKLGLTENEANLVRLAGYYSLVNDYQHLIKIYLSLTRLKPDNFNYWKQLILDYQAKGDLRMVQQLAKELAVKFPNQFLAIKKIINNSVNFKKEPQ